MIDVQSGSVAPQFSIEAVGVTGLKYPLLARDALSGEVQRIAADWRMSVALPASKRGTHMSRFIEALHARAAEPLDLDGLYQFATSLTEVLEAETTDLSAAFPWFREVKAPVSGKAAFLEIKVAFAAVTGPRASKTLTVSVPAKALCPCSKAISDRGAHNQRSDIEVSLELAPHAPVPAINRIVALLEASASSPVYPLLKREDEKYVTEYAYDNPAFVEDIVRGAAARLLDVAGVVRFTVSAINRESIHAHDCFARIVHQP